MAGTVEDVRDENYKEFTDPPAAIVAYGLATCEPRQTYGPIMKETAAKVLRRKSRQGQNAYPWPLPRD